MRDIPNSSRLDREQKHELLAALVDSSDDAIIAKDLKGIIQTWNKGAERIYGYRPDEVLGRSALMLLPPDRADEEQQILSRINNGERIDHFETARLRNDGTRISVSLTVSPIRNAAGVIIGASHIARNITERTLMELQPLSWLPSSTPPRMPSSARIWTELS